MDKPGMDKPISNRGECLDCERVFTCIAIIGDKPGPEEPRLLNETERPLFIKGAPCRVRDSFEFDFFDDFGDLEERFEDEPEEPNEEPELLPKKFIAPVATSPNRLITNHCSAEIDLSTH